MKSEGEYKKQNHEDIALESYLIYPVKNIFNVGIKWEELKSLQKVHEEIKKDQQRRQRNVANVNHQQPLRQQQQNQPKKQQNDIICFICKNINSMLMAIYCLLLRNPKQDSLKEIFEENLHQNIVQQKKSTIKKVMHILGKNMKYYLSLPKEQMAIDPLRKQVKQPLLMSYTMNTNQVQINSKLIIDIMRVFKQKDKLSEIMNKLIGYCLKSRELLQTTSQSLLQIVNDKKYQQGQSYYLTFGNKTDEIIAIIPYSEKRNQKGSQYKYKLFLFQNLQSYFKFIQKQKKSLQTPKKTIPTNRNLQKMNSQRMNEDWNQENLDSDKNNRCEDSPEQFMSNTSNNKEQPQKLKRRQFIHRINSYWRKTTKRIRKSPNAANSHGQTAAPQTNVDWGLGKVALITQVVCLIVFAVFDLLICLHFLKMLINPQCEAVQICNFLWQIYESFKSLLSEEYLQKIIDEVVR